MDDPNTKAAIRARADSLLITFLAQGAERVEADVLQPAAVLLDLYGEDIRGRAYVTQDPLRGELMLRPDFTVPVVQRHMDDRAEPARYAYAGEVFRQQEDDPTRASEYVQVGFEVFDRGPAAEVEAEVFLLFHRALPGAQLQRDMGDLGILIAAVQGLDTSPARKAALMRHLWRPTRFRALLHRFAAPVSQRNMPTTGPMIGLRSEAGIAARLTAMAEDAETPPLAEAEVAALNTLMDLAGHPTEVAEAIKPLAATRPKLDAALTRLTARLAVFADAGLPVDQMRFAVTYGRRAMEYYDGFVFGIGRPGAPPIASGGRYDALTKALGQGRSVPAVGGVIRPGLMLAEGV